MRSLKPAPPPSFGFDVEGYLKSSGAGHTAKQVRKGGKVFEQGDPCSTICYLRGGVVKLSVLSRIGREAVIGVLGPGDFFGESCLAGHTLRTYTATAMSDADVVLLERPTMSQLLHDQQAFAERFIAHMLARSARIEADLVDQLFNSSERRLARTLLLLSRYGQVHPQTALPKISQQTLAEMIGSTRTRVNFFMNRFKRLGFIEESDGIKINPALLGVVLHDDNTQESEDDAKSAAPPAAARPRLRRAARKASPARRRTRR